MIFKSFLLGNLLSLCMKIINSVVVVGLYYGFLTTFSIGPSYLFLLRARVMEEGTEKEVSATTGFITGQLMMFISIYYAPLHLALGRPHTITVLVLPYLLFHFFWNNHKNFFFYGSTTRNSMRNLSIQCVFLNNLIFQLFNHFILPSSTLARLVNIYMFRCNNKMLFVTSSFVGWLIGHILFMKWVGLVLFWIRKNNSIRSNKYLVSELRNSMARIFSILLFITCVYYLGRIPSPIVTKKLKETAETEERGESEEETDVEIETISETKGTKQEQEGSIEEDPSPSLCSEEKEDLDKIDETEEIQVNGKEKEKDKFHFKETCYKNSPVYENTYLDGNQENSKLEILKLKEDKDLLWFEKPLVTLLFDYKRWNRPLRYIKNDQFEDAVRDEMSHYFFFTCESDGKERISFTYPPSLSIFFEMIKGKILLSTMEKPSSEELYNRWVYTNKTKKQNINNAFFNRIDALERGSLKLDVLEKRIRLCNNETEQECLPEGYDPFLNGTYRGSGKKEKRYLHSSLNMNESFSVEDCIWINKFNNILPTNYQGFDEKKDKFEEKLLLSKEGKLNSENIIKFLFGAVTPDINYQRIIKEYIGIKEICKEVPQWSYKLITSLEQQDGEIEEEMAEDHEIRSRKANHVVIFTDTERTNSTKNTNDEVEEVFVLRYSQESDFRRDIIKGSMRAQRRKTVIWEPFQTNIHSPLFLDRIYKRLFFSVDTSRIMNLLFRNWMIKSTELKNSYFEEEAKEKDRKRKKKGEENDRLAVAESWDTVLFGQSIRGCLLIAHSTFRKYIGLPSVIIAKNFCRILLFQPPEWNEDWREWSREMHVKCTYNGVQLSEMEFPKNWLTEGIQIKILYPFYPKPWNSSKQRSHHRNPRGTKENSCFLTVWGMETEFPFGSPRRRPSFLKPIFKELENQIIKKNTQNFLGLRVFKEKTKGFLKDSKKKESWTHKKAFFLKENQIVHESSSRIRSMSLTNYSLTEKKTEDLADRTSRIKNQIEKIINDKKKAFLIPDRNINPNDISCNDKRLEDPKNIWQIFQRRSARLIRKRHSFLNFLLEKIYMDTLLFLINIPRINIQFSLDLKRKKGGIDKKSYNDEIKKEGVEEKKRMHFISIKKRALSNISNQNLHHFCDPFDLSQAYVFYKLSQTQVIKKYHMRSVLQYHGTSFFIKDGIKAFFGTQGILDSESRHKKLSNFETNGWKNWLNSHYNYQYNFSKISSSQLVLQKRGNGVNQSHTISNKASTKFNSYEKILFFHYEKQNAYVMDALSSKNKIFKKQYGYDLLSQKYINYREGKDSYISLSPLQVKGSLKIPYKYNTNKPPIFYMPVGIYMSHYLGEDCIVDTDKKMDRKYFDWKTIYFCLRKKINIEAWANMDTETRMNQKTKTGINYYSISNQIDTKDLSYLAIDKKKKPSSGKYLFFWMGMNEEILNRPISNLQLWFFPELLGLYDAYRIKPWIIPTKSLLFHFNGNQTTSEKKKDLELENQNQEEKEESVQEDLGSDLSNQEKEVKEDYGDSYIKKSRKKKKWKSTTEAELDFFLKRYFLFQLRWHGSLDQRIINSIQIYCLLLRLNNPKQIAISSIQRGEMRLDILLIQKDLNLTELINKGVLIIEPVRLSIQGDGLFIMYQTIAISLVHKSNHQTNRKNKQKENGYNNSFAESIKRHRHGRSLEKRDAKNYAFFVPENILAPRCRRELRIQICLNSEKINVLDRNKTFYNSKKNNIRNCGTFLDESKYLDKDSKNLDRNKVLKLKFFLWPNYRLEDLACMNRYWFDTSNGSRFSMSRIYMYPRFTIN
uniref:hypothetical chloroplast RF1 n=1 Tax=Meconopsis racemosa var. racemosa TaxID=2920504 RepID=UPI001FA7588C|nr:hypothetical chloroplast RF1 [Meconopsis racemosa var. racemosa]ULU28845.1 hypothetical chloroplast RF1 [Meconopsis racemosa var. racemosa]